MVSACLARTPRLAVWACFEAPAELPERRHVVDRTINENRAYANSSLQAQNQHLVTKPVFDALFAGHSFTTENAMSRAMQDHVKSKLAPYKYPRWIEFRADLPKTATGKIQRFKLRSEGAAR